MSSTFRKNFAEELLLNSGQFALFYIIMQFIIEKSHFFGDSGHVALLTSLVLQTLLLAKFKNRRKYRILLPFIVPIVYTASEFTDGTSYILNTAHIGFWFYATLSTLFKLLENSNRRFIHKISEVSLVLLNVFIFLFLYFYFDTWKEVQYPEFLTITNIGNYVATFLADPTHWYLIFGGTLLAITIALGRNEINNLNQKIIHLFGTYVDKNISDKILDEGEFISQKENLCILFSDIVNFTKLCENNSAISISKMLNIYFEFWNDIVNKHNGTIDKYIGDAIMVIFGLDQKESPCELAVSCALEVVKNKNKLFTKLEEHGLPSIDGFGIGCHFGELIVGDIGSEERKNFTVIGDTVNIASRLESATRDHQCDIIISETTYTLLSDSLQNEFVKIGAIHLKGKSEPVDIWGNG